MLFLQVAGLAGLSRQRPLTLGDLFVDLVLSRSVGVDLRLDLRALRLELVGQLRRGGDHLVEFTLGGGGGVTGLLLAPERVLSLGPQVPDLRLDGGQAHLGVDVRGLALRDGGDAAVLDPHGLVRQSHGVRQRGVAHAQDEGKVRGDTTLLVGLVGDLPDLGGGHVQLLLARGDLGEDLGSARFGLPHAFIE
ncbi:hypothetical protein ACFFX0_24165 [Citricoccus parietis]|uniref:Uncharacterized protein n=1 Tax=Citricoccus parietis TaxID=592307 RepID=A0ABV5G5D9_9MICC